MDKPKRGEIKTPKFGSREFEEVRFLGNCVSEAFVGIRSTEKIGREIERILKAGSSPRFAALAMVWHTQNIIKAVVKSRATESAGSRRADKQPDEEIPL